MSKTIHYFFTAMSPWAYLGLAPFLDLVRRHGASVVYKPVGFGAVFEESGGLPLARRHPLRQRYRLVELQRWRAHRNVPLVLQPKHVPFNPSLADRVAIALTQAGHDPAGYLTRLHAAIWAEERDAGNPQVLADVLMAAGHDAPAVMAAAESETAFTAYAAHIGEALALGVFGAPSYVVDGEVFWGQDRLGLLDDMLTSGRAPYGPSGAPFPSPAGRGSG